MEDFIDCEGRLGLMRLKLAACNFFYLVGIIILYVIIYSENYNFSYNYNFNEERTVINE